MNGHKKHGAPRFFILLYVIYARTFLIRLDVELWSSTTSNPLHPIKLWLHHGAPELTQSKNTTVGNCTSNFTRQCISKLLEQRHCDPLQRFGNLDLFVTRLWFCREELD